MTARRWLLLLAWRCRMVDLGINLRIKRKEEVLVQIWRRRLNYIVAGLAVVVVVLVLGIFLARRLLLSEEDNIRAQRESLRAAIEQKREVEGLYTILQSRLRTILLVEEDKNTPEDLASLLIDLISKRLVISQIRIASDRVEIEASTTLPENVEVVINELLTRNFSGYELAKPTVSDTAIDQNGKINLVLAIPYQEVSGTSGQ